MTSCSVIALEDSSVSTVLAKLGCKVVVGPISRVFTRLEVRGEVMVVGEEELF